MNKKIKPALSRPLIIDSGLALATGQNVDSVSIHKIAKQLGVTPMAIYRHFDNKADLQAEMLDQFIINAAVLPEETLHWQEWLAYVGTHMYDALKEQPSWIPLFGQVQLKPGAQAVKLACIDTLEQAGFSELSANQAFIGMIQCVIGAANQYLYVSSLVSSQEGGEPSVGEQSLSSNSLLNCSITYFIKGLAAELTST